VWRSAPTAALGGSFGSYHRWFVSGHGFLSRAVRREERSPGFSPGVCNRADSALADRREKPITKVTFTLNEEFISIHFVVWQFWGRAAEASWTEKSKALFYCPVLTSRTSRILVERPEGVKGFCRKTRSVPGAPGRAIALSV
jgi:hypothetical protein